MSYSFFGTYSTTSYKILEEVNYDESFDNFVTIEINKYCSVKVNKTWSEYNRLNNGSYIINLMFQDNDDVSYFESDTKIIFEYGKNIKEYDSDYILERKKPYLKLEVNMVEKTITFFTNRKEMYYISLDNNDEFSSKPMVTMYEENKVHEKKTINISQLLSEYKKSIDNIY